MRNISANGLAQLAKRHGNEPVNIIEVDWIAGRAPASYADKDVQGIPGKIVELGDLDDVVAHVTAESGVTNSDSSQQIDVTLDDVDGSIKTIFDSYDVHKRPVRVYQWFEGLDLSDKFLIFAGKINTPISWNERDRTVKITVVSQLEDQEIGFSAEEGQFPYLPADLVGKAWPMLFGTVIDSPALQINKALEACTLAGVGIVSGSAAMGGLPLYENGTNSDGGGNAGNALTVIQMNIILEASECWMGVDDQKSQQLLDQYNKMAEKLNEELAQKAAQEACARMKRAQQIANATSQGTGANPIPTIGGEDFPQNTPITININGGLFTGSFVGNNFYVTSSVHPDNETAAQQAANDSRDPCPPPPAKAQDYDYKMDVPCGCGDFFNECQLRRQGWVITTSGGASRSASSSSVMQQFWADPGSRIVMESDSPLTYVISIVPGRVLAVKAFKQFQGPRTLCLVPPSYYTVQTVRYGTITAVQIVMNKPLSYYTTDGTNDGWSDEVYVTFQSNIGPDIIDILTYIIDNYTDLGWDEESFEYVRTKLAPFPANFPLLDRKNTIDVLKDIAFQCRCAISLRENTFYLKYLPEEPVALGTPQWATAKNRVNDTITLSDIDAEQGVEVELTVTEDLVTKMKVSWRISNAPDNEYTPDKDRNQKCMILRHNIARYGVQEQDYDWYIFNQPDIILKCATFWLIRLSNTWKRIRFRTFLNKLNLETFDTVLFDDRVNGVGKGYVASGPVKAIVEKATYNSAENYIDFECLAPVRAGETTQYKFFWPAELPVSATWPPQEDIASGDAGGGGIGTGATGKLPIGYHGRHRPGRYGLCGRPQCRLPAAERSGRQPTHRPRLRRPTGDCGLSVRSTTAWHEATIEPDPQLLARQPASHRSRLAAGSGHRHFPDQSDRRGRRQAEQLRLSQGRTRLERERQADDRPCAGACHGLRPGW